MFKLSSGQSIPSIGLGTCEFHIRNNVGRAQPTQVKTAVLKALDLGYRHLDCAYVYENEKEIGEALKETCVPRDQIFITSKLWNTFHQPELVRKGCLQTLGDLDIPQLDLYLMHWPLAFVNDGTGDSVKDPVTGVSQVDTTVSLMDTWRAMEALVDEGLVKSIGVSNFNIPKLQGILKQARIQPVMNQVSAIAFLILG